MLTRLRHRVQYAAFTLFVLSGLICVPFFFQNCAPPMDSAQTTDYSSLADSLPFAYEADMQYLAYMTCSAPLFYSWIQVGAESAGGIRLSDAFYTASLNATSSDILNMLTTSSRYATLAATLNAQSNPTNVLNGGTSTPSETISSSASTLVNDMYTSHTNGAATPYGARPIRASRLVSGSLAFFALRYIPSGSQWAVPGDETQGLKFDATVNNDGSLGVVAEYDLNSFNFASGATNSPKRAFSCRKYAVYRSTDTAGTIDSLLKQYCPGATKSTRFGLTVHEGNQGNCVEMPAASCTSATLLSLCY